MNYLKKLLGYIVTMAMVFTLTGVGIGAVHAENTTYTITLTGTATGHTYEAYQIFTGDLKTNDNGEKVLSNVKWGTGVTYSGTKSAADVAKALGEKENIENKMTIDQLIGNLTLTTPVKTVTSAKNSTVIDKLAAGYYLVKDKDTTQANTSDAYTKFIVQVVGNSEVKVKSDVPTVEKKVKDKYDTDGTTSEWQDSADYDIGDDVPYQITGSMPGNIGDYKSYKYVFTDTMSKGLTFKEGSAKIMIGTTDLTKKFTENVTTNDTDGATVVTWTCNNLKADEIKTAGVELTPTTKVVVTYSAELNKDAVIGSAGNPNTVNLTYSNNPNDGGEGETGKTPDDKNKVFTYKAVVNKVDQDKKSLKGAGFTLQKNVNGKYTDVKSFTAGEATTFEFTGLDDGDYKLIELTTPAGYNTIDPIEFTISATHQETSDDPQLLTLSGDVKSGEATFTADTTAGSLTTDVVNKPGSQLPETGGMGTTLLYVLGGVLVALAAAYVIYTKKHEKA